jgi:amidase
MARTIADVALLFRLLSGQDTADPASAPVPLREPSLEELRCNRIGFFEDDQIVPVTAETRAAVSAATAALRDAGFQVEPFRPATLESLRRLWQRFLSNAEPCFMRPQSVAEKAS